jgi:hypothetical protein
MRSSFLVIAAVVLLVKASEPDLVAPTVVSCADTVLIGGTIDVTFADASGMDTTKTTYQTKSIFDDTSAATPFTWDVTNLIGTTAPIPGLTSSLILHVQDTLGNEASITQTIEVQKSEFVHINAAPTATDLRVLASSKRATSLADCKLLAYDNALTNHDELYWEYNSNSGSCTSYNVSDANFNLVSNAVEYITAGFAPGVGSDCPAGASAGSGNVRLPPVLSVTLDHDGAVGYVDTHIVLIDTIPPRSGLNASVDLTPLTAATSWTAASTDCLFSLDHRFLLSELLAATSPGGKGKVYITDSEYYKIMYKIKFEFVEQVDYATAYIAKRSVDRNVDFDLYLILISKKEVVANFTTDHVHDFRVDWAMVSTTGPTFSGALSNIATVELIIETSCYDTDLYLQQYFTAPTFTGTDIDTISFVAMGPAGASTQRWNVTVTYKADKSYLGSSDISLAWNVFNKDDQPFAQQLRLTLHLASYDSWSAYVVDLVFHPYLQISAWHNETQEPISEVINNSPAYLRVVFPPLPGTNVTSVTFQNVWITGTQFPATMGECGVYTPTTLFLYWNGGAIANATDLQIGAQRDDCGVLASHDVAKCFTFNASVPCLKAEANYVLHADVNIDFLHSSAKRTDASTETQHLSVEFTIRKNGFVARDVPRVTRTLPAPVMPEAAAPATVVAPTRAVSSNLMIGLVAVLSVATVAMVSCVIVAAVLIIRLRK